jgi:hypothetical protein
MKQPIRKLTANNIDTITAEYLKEVELIGDSIRGKRGVTLMNSLKREQLKTGPYIGLTLFETANRVMSDLVILRGVAGLLREKVFCFDEYIVEFGNENKNGFDIRASDHNVQLVGEAFNVAPSFFQQKKNYSVKKIKKNGEMSQLKLVMFNSDAPPVGYVPRIEAGFKFVFVDINTGDIRVEYSKDTLNSP